MRPHARLLICLVLALGPAPAGAAEITVFAAASLTDSLEEIGAAYERKTGLRVRYAFAGSSTLARQIEAGAPADVVALASTEWADYLAERDLIRAGSRVSPIGNRLAVAAPADSPVTLSDPPTAPEMLAALGPHGRLALGDPAHVPAGIYARQALESLGLWDALVPHLAPTGDVRAALALVVRGEAPLGIVYASDINTVPGARLVRLLPADSHRPITYAFAVVAGGNEDKALRFLHFLSRPEPHAEFARHGFTLR
jgi:molybdate transport system substrate-binding protein